MEFFKKNSSKSGDFGTLFSHKILCFVTKHGFFFFFGCDVADMVIIHKMI